MSGDAILSAENSGKPLVGRGSAPKPAGVWRAHSAPQTPLAGGEVLLLEVCGSTGTRRYTRPNPYPRVDVSRVGSGTGTTSTGTGIPGFTRKEHDFFHDFGARTFLFLHVFLQYSI